MLLEVFQTWEYNDDRVGAIAPMLREMGWEQEQANNATMWKLPDTPLRLTFHDIYNAFALERTLDTIVIVEEKLATGLQTGWPSFINTTIIFGRRKAGVEIEHFRQVVAQRMIECYFPAEP